MNDRELFDRQINCGDTDIYFRDIGKFHGLLQQATTIISGLQQPRMSTDPINETDDELYEFECGRLRKIVENMLLALLGPGYTIVKEEDWNIKSQMHRELQAHLKQRDMDDDVLEQVQWGMKEAEKHCDGEKDCESFGRGIAEQLWYASKRITDAMDAFSSLGFMKRRKPIEVDIVDNG